MSDDETEWHQIEMLAAALMAGFIEKLDEGRPRKKYLDGKEEDRARAAMARLLRSGRPLTQDFRDCLAVLFDPSASAHPASDRKLVFKNRSGGRWPDHVRNTRIAQYIHNCIRREVTEWRRLRKKRRAFSASAFRLSGTCRAQAATVSLAASAASAAGMRCVGNVSAQDGASFIRHSITSFGVLPRPSGVKSQVRQIQASPAMTRCRFASVPLDCA